MLSIPLGFRELGSIGSLVNRGNLPLANASLPFCYLLVVMVVMFRATAPERRPKDDRLPHENIAGHRWFRGCRLRCPYCSKSSQQDRLRAARRVCGGGTKAFVHLGVAEPRRNDRSQVRGADAPACTSRRQPTPRGAGPEDKGSGRRDRAGPPDVRTPPHGYCAPG